MSGLEETIAFADAMMAAKRWEKAAAACRETLSRHPEATALRTRLATCLLAESQIDAARQELLKARARAPSDAKIHRLLGQLELRDGRLPQAVSALEEALRLEPDDERTRTLLQRVKRAREKLDAKRLRDREAKKKKRAAQRKAREVEEARHSGEVGLGRPDAPSAAFETEPKTAETSSDEPKEYSLQWLAGSSGAFSLDKLSSSRPAADDDPADDDDALGAPVPDDASTAPIEPQATMLTETRDPSGVGSVQALDAGLAPLMDSVPPMLPGFDDETVTQSPIAHKLLESISTGESELDTDPGDSPLLAPSEDLVRRMDDQPTAPGDESEIMAIAATSTGVIVGPDGAIHEGVRPRRADERITASAKRPDPARPRDIPTRPIGATSAEEREQHTRPLPESEPPAEPRPSSQQAFPAKFATTAAGKRAGRGEAPQTREISSPQSAPPGPVSPTGATMAATEIDLDDETGLDFRMDLQVDEEETNLDMAANLGALFDSSGAGKPDLYASLDPAKARPSPTNRPPARNAPTPEVSPTYRTPKIGEDVAPEPQVGETYQPSPGDDDLLGQAAPDLDSDPMPAAGTENLSLEEIHSIHGVSVSSDEAPSLTSGDLEAITSDVDAPAPKRRRHPTLAGLGTAIPSMGPNSGPANPSSPVAAPPMAPPPSAPPPPLAGPPLGAGLPSAPPPVAGPPASVPPMAAPPMAGPPMTAPPMAGPPMTAPPMAGPPSAPPPPLAGPPGPLGVPPMATLGLGDGPPPPIGGPQGLDPALLGAPAPEGSSDPLDALPTTARPRPETRPRMQLEAPVPAQPVSSVPAGFEPPTAPRADPIPGEHDTNDPQRKLRVAALVGAPLALVAIALLIIQSVVRSQNDEAVARAVEIAETDGREVSVVAALREDRERPVGGDEAHARRAWLFAVALLEHGANERERLETELEALGTSLPPRARIAAAYLALEDGNLDRTEQLLARLGPGAVQGESDYARALLHLRQGRVDEAASAAGRAQQVRATSARFAARLGETMLARGAAAEVRELVESVGETPALGVVEARALLALQDPEAADRLAREVLEDEGTSAREARRALLVRVEANVALERDGARALVEELLDSGWPESDELYVGRLTRALLDLEMHSQAGEVLDRLPEGSVDPGAVAALRAEIHLLAGRLEEAHAALQNAARGPRTDLVRGRIAEARGQEEAAVEAYEIALRDASVRHDAVLRLARLHARAGRHARVVSTVRPHFDDHPEDAEYGRLLVEAELSRDRVRAANRVLEDMRSPREDPDRQVAEALVDLTAGRFADARSKLEGAIGHRPNEPGLHGTLGRVARIAGDRSRAERAFARARELDPRQPDALLGAVALALDKMDTSAADAALGEARTALGDAAIGHLEWRRRVLLGEGYAAIAPLRDATRSGHPLVTQDAYLWADLGRAYLQSGSSRGAQRSLARAIELDSDCFPALVAEAQRAAMRADDDAVRDRLDQANAAAERRNLGTRAQALLSGVRALLAYQNGNLGSAGRLADEAISHDEHIGLGHYVKALVALDNGGAPAPHFQAAAEGLLPPAAAFYNLVYESGGRSEKCAAARRYYELAPRSRVARQLRRFIRSCR